MGSVSRVHTFASAAVLTAAQLNNEFDNLLTSSAINGGLDATNLGVTAGQITASKAVVVDGSRNLDDGTASNQINNLVLSGTLTVAGATTQTGALSIDDNTDSTSTTTGSIHTDGGVGIALDLIVGNDVKLLTDSSVLSLGIGSDATLTHDGTTGLTIAANPVIVDSGDALTLDAHTGIVIFKDAGSEVLRFTEGNSGDVTIKLATNGKDLVFTDNGDATGLKVLDAAAGINVPGEVQTTKIAYTDGDDAITIADGGGVTTSGTLATTGAATLASLVCTAAGTFGGGYGATGATISTLGVGQFNGALTTDGVFTAASLDISGNADIDGTLEADVITLNGTALGSLYSPIAGSSSIATVGTVTAGAWQSSTVVASAYLDAQTAHLNVTQSFTGAKTFGAATQFNSTVTVGVNDTGYDVQLFGATDGSNILWDQSADDLIFTNAGIAVGSDATGDIYFRNASGFLARLGVGSDGQVLTSTGTLPNWEAAAAGGIASVVDDTSPQLGGNLDVNGQSIVSDGSNENIPITPHGTGSVVISKADINGGAIDATAIGAGTPSTIAGTTLSATGNVSFDGGSFVFNEAGADKDFRIEGDTQANLFVADASTDRIGIGTTAPGSTLDVVGTGQFGNSTGYLYIGNLGQSLSWNRNPTNGAISNSSAHSYQFQQTASATPASDYLAVQVYDEGGTQVTANAFAINGAGNVGIGTTTPGSALTVTTNHASNYTCHFTNLGNDANRYGIIIQGGADNASGNTTYINALDGDGGSIGHISNISDTFQLVDGSDERGKKDIVDTAVDGLATINAIVVKDFTRIKSGGRVSAGFTAQQMLTAYPSAVSQPDAIPDVLYAEDIEAVLYGEGDELPDGKSVGDVKTEAIKEGDVETEGYTPWMGIGKDALIGPLVKAVQQLSAKIAALESA